MNLRTKVPLALTVALALIAVAATSGRARATDDFESGDRWSYYVDMALDEHTLDGTVTYEYDGKSSKTVDGETYDTYEIRYHGILHLGGIIDIEPSMSGSAQIVGVQSLDQATGNLVVRDDNISTTIAYVRSGDFVMEQSWIHEVTTYSPPGGTGDEPEILQNGSKWVKTFTTHSAITTYKDGNITNDIVSESVSKNYTCLGVETISVPAGTFECIVIRTDYDNSSSMVWYCDETGSYVQSISFGASGYSSETLTSFSYSPPSSANAVSIDIVLIVTAAAIALIIAVVLVWAHMNRKKKQEDGQQESGPATPPTR